MTPLVTAPKTASRIVVDLLHLLEKEERAGSAQQATLLAQLELSRRRTPTGATERSTLDRLRHQERNVSSRLHLLRRKISMIRMQIGAAPTHATTSRP